MRDLSSLRHDDALAEAYHTHRPYVLNLAYQMLGDIGAAEDVAQEAFLRLARTGPGEVANLRGWLTVVAGRLCLDHVSLTRVWRECPGDPGDVAAFEASPPLNQSPSPDPSDRVTLDDEIREALLRVLGLLSPGERVAFVLHDIFQVPFASIADTVGRPVATCRQLARRARIKVVAATPQPTDVTDTELHRVTETFITACANGDTQALVAVLDPSVWGAATILADPTPPPQINHGPLAVATNLLRYLGPSVTLVNAPVGQPVLFGFLNRQLFVTIALTMREHRVTKIEVTVDAATRIAAGHHDDHGW
jgi:RNA polymerase sigma-70 factor (ECF subfamily)